MRYCEDFLCLNQINIARRCLGPVLDHSIIVAGVCKWWHNLLFVNTFKMFVGMSYCPLMCCDNEHYKQQSVLPMHCVSGTLLCVQESELFLLNPEPREYLVLSSYCVLTREYSASVHSPASSSFSSVCLCF